MPLESGTKLVEAQVKDSQDKMNKSGGTTIFNFLFEVFELCRRWPWCWNVTGNRLRRRTDLIVQPYSTYFLNCLNYAGDGHGART